MATCPGSPHPKWISKLDSAAGNDPKDALCPIGTFILVGREKRTLDRGLVANKHGWHCITELVMVSFLGTTARFFSYRRICRNRIFLRGTRGGNCGEARGSTTVLLIFVLGPWEMLSRVPIGCPAMTPDTERLLALG